MTSLEKDKYYTLDEFLFLVKEEDRAELYEGRPIFMAPASYEHEGVVASLIGEFVSALKGSNCIVFGTNLQVIFPFENERKDKGDVTVLPDISIVCDRNKLQNKRCYGAPDLLVEVLSPGTFRNDLLLKKHYYEKAGVKEYLIIDYQNQFIEKHLLQDGSFQLKEVYSSERKTFKSSIFPIISFSIDDIFGFMNR